jgi:hypothetical protein
VLQQFQITDLLKFSSKGKHVFLDFFSLLTCDYKASSSSEAEAIVKYLKGHYETIKRQEFEVIYSLNQAIISYSSL